MSWWLLLSSQLEDGQHWWVPTTTQPRSCWDASSVRGVNRRWRNLEHHVYYAYEHLSWLYPPAGWRLSGSPVLVDISVIRSGCIFWAPVWRLVNMPCVSSFFKSFLKKKRKHLREKRGKKQMWQLKKKEEGVANKMISMVSLYWNLIDSFPKCLSAGLCWDFQFWCEVGAHFLLIMWKVFLLPNPSF